MAGNAEDNLQAAERVVSLLIANEAPAMVIGAVALAAHRYGPIRKTLISESMRTFLKCV